LWKLPDIYDAVSLRFMQDERSSEVLDLMFETISFDYGYLHVGGMGGIKADMRKTLPKSNPNVSSLFKMWERKLETELKGEREAIERLMNQWRDK
jgi:hypothetical protein